MSQCDRPHVVSESTSPVSGFHMLKNIHIQCDVSKSHTETSQLSIDPSSSSTMDTRPTTPAAVDLYIDRITSLERTVCSNFACCGAQLSDLHALLEHFEEDHVVVLAPNGKRVYPPEGLRSVPLHPILSAATTPASSRSSSMSPSSPTSPLTPSSSVPSSPSDFSPPTSGPFANRKSSLIIAPVYTPFTPSLPVDPAYPYPDTSEIIMAHEPSFEFPPDLFPPFALKSPVPTSTTSSDEDDEMSDGSTPETPLSPIPTYVYGTQKGQLLGAIPKHVMSSSSKIKIAVKALNASLASSSTKSNKTKSRYIGTSSNPNLRRREKAYRCPTPRCTKSYLNPNGLKYHMEKGTCKIDPPCEELQVPSADLMATATSNGGPVNTQPASSPLDVRMESPSAQAKDLAAPSTTPKIHGAHPLGETHPGSGSYCHHNLSAVPVHPHQQIHPSPDVNFNGKPAVAIDLQGQPFSNSRAPAPAYVQPSPSQSHSPTPSQTQSQPQYHYPVPSYPQITGPNGLLSAGYTTYIHHPYYQTDRASQHSESYGPIFPPITASVTVSAHSQ